MKIDNFAIPLSFLHSSPSVLFTFESGQEILDDHRFRLFLRQAEGAQLQNLIIAYNDSVLY